MAYRRAGLGDSNINPTTIWTPSGGFNFNTPGASSGPAVFQAPTTVPVPACSLDTQPGGAAFSSACIAQVLAAQQQNMQLGNNANYNVDLANCLNTYPQPPDCYTRTFGLTPTGGFTSDAHVQGGQTILDANGNPVGSPPPVASAPSSYVATPAAQKQPVLAPPLPAPAGSGSSSDPAAPTQNYVTQATDFLSSGVSVAGSSFPIWGLAAAGVALLLLMGGKH
jgi:hypothetical protein